MRNLPRFGQIRRNSIIQFRTIYEDGCVTLAKGGATFLKLCRHHCRVPATAMLVVRRLSLCTFPVAELAEVCPFEVRDEPFGLCSAVCTAVVHDDTNMLFSET